MVIIYTEEVVIRLPCFDVHFYKQYLFHLRHDRVVTKIFNASLFLFELLITLFFGL